MHETIWVGKYLSSPHLTWNKIDWLSPNPSNLSLCKTIRNFVTQFIWGKQIFERRISTNKYIFKLPLGALFSRSVGLSSKNNKIIIAKLYKMLETLYNEKIIFFCPLPNICTPSSKHGQETGASLTESSIFVFVKPDILGCLKIQT